MDNDIKIEKEGKKEKIIGISMIAGVILLAIILTILLTNNKKNNALKDVYVATGGGKEEFIADADVVKKLEEKYKLNVIYDNWSNGKTITAPLVREYVHLGNNSIPESEWSVNCEKCSKYDVLFTSDERYYDYYKLQPNKSLGEADRYYVKGGSLTLNTPIVIYSWKDVADALIKEKIVENKDGVYYITDTNKLLNYIIEGKTWNDIGLDIYGKININSTDPVTSSPGATYYGLLLSIMTGGDMSEQKVLETLPRLKEFYIKSGYMNNTPADLFERYLKTGMGGEPMIVDYEKSMIDFMSSSPDAFNQVKDDIRILYPTPTIWNSHCFAVFNDKGAKLYEALNDKEIGQIAWEKYGFRTGVTGGTYDVSSIGLGVPQAITSTVTSLKMDTYNRLIEYLK